MIYLKRSDGCYVSFGGMTEGQITQMLAAQDLTCEFLTEEEYQQAIS